MDVGMMAWVVAVAAGAFVIGTFVGWMGAWDRRGELEKELNDSHVKALTKSNEDLKAESVKVRIAWADDCRLMTDVGEMLDDVMAKIKTTREKIG